MTNAQDLIAALDLKPLLPEGGYYRETYRSAHELPLSALLQRSGSSKAACSAIYYLLTADTFSALHRLPTDEIYHFYLGDAVLMLPASAERRRTAEHARARSFARPVPSACGARRRLAGKLPCAGRQLRSAWHHHGAGFCFLGL